MELIPSREAANCAATQELPSVLWNPKVHYRLHKSPLLIAILSQIDPIPTIPSYLSKINCNIVHPPTSWSSHVTNLVKSSSTEMSTVNCMRNTHHTAMWCPSILFSPSWRIPQYHTHWVRDSRGM
jgi:hypothetical protein